MKNLSLIICVSLSIVSASCLSASEPPANDCGCQSANQFGTAGTVNCNLSDKPQVVIAAIGGWKSCLTVDAKDQYIGDICLATIDRLRMQRPDWDIDLIMYCSPGLGTAKFESPVRWSSDLGMGKVAEQEIGCSIARHKKSPNTKVFVIGHSHGGWMAMRAAQSLGQLDGLFTLEPVSSYQCDTRHWLKNRSKRPIKRRQQKIAGCRRAPADIDWNVISNATGGNWTNFVLHPCADKGDVHSSVIPQANNPIIWADHDGIFFPHHMLALSNETWSIIENNILEHLDTSTEAASPSEHENIIEANILSHLDQ